MNLIWSFLPVLTALIWGIAFVAQSSGSAYMGPATFTAARFLIAPLVLLPVIFIRDRLSGRAAPDAAEKKKLRRAGIQCGFFLCLASLLQQAGITMGTSAGKAGFLTAIYIVLVPVISYFLFKKEVRLPVWIAVVIALAGLYLLCMSGPLSLQASDLLVLSCALVFALQILSVDHYAPQMDTVRLSAIEFFVTGLIAAAVMVVTELIPMGFTAWIQGVLTADVWIPLLYAAVFSSGIAYTLQTVSQKRVNPTVASILFSLESVFAAIGGWIILGQRMTLREMAGCVVVFLAVVIAQFPGRKCEKRRSDESESGVIKSQEAEDGERIA